ncbi:ATP-binding protein [Desulfobacula sp.]|uniref:ATP-binding protein n=1 Tax=Desulfobacula sp. TaxID=2593537 RepID=UPI001EC0AE15|nr:ATP-binding protein [Desulfobacula sp.]
MGVVKTVKIPHDYFFKMAVKDYYAWRSALFREFIQNSVDAGATEISFEFDGKYLSVTDNGCGMTLDVIEEALLTLGGSRKLEGSIGGIGKAKEILYFAWAQWEISTNGIWIVGHGPQYEIKRTDLHVGTMSKIQIDDKIEAPGRYIREYLKLSGLEKTGVTVLYNGEKVDCTGIDYGENIYTVDGLGDLHRVENESSHFDGGKVIVQSHGLYMFTNYSVLDKCYVFNITMPSYDCLTSSRDSFVGEWQDSFSKMIGKVAIDTESTNLKKETIIHVNALNRTSKDFDPIKRIKDTVGDEGFVKLQELAKADGKALNDLSADDVLDLMDVNYLLTETVMDKATEKKIKTFMTSAKSVNKTKTFDACLAWYKKAFTEGFIIITDDDITTDLVHVMFDTETLKLAWLWKEIVDDIANRAGIAIDYGYGLIISEDGKIVAQSRDGFLLINPYPYFEMSWEDATLDIMLTAAEEIAHHLGYSFHNESFKCKYTDLIKVALGGRVNIKSLLNNIKKVTKKHGIKTSTSNLHQGNLSR